MEAWMEDELVKDIPKEKLEFLGKMVDRGQGKSQKQLMSQMLPLIKEARAKGLQFTAAETSAAIAAIRKHSSQEENSQIDNLLSQVEKARSNHKEPAGPKS